MRWSALGGHYILHATSTKHADKEHDKYQHLVTYSDETVIKHFYLNVDDEVLTFNQTIHSQRVILLHIKISKFSLGSSNYTVEN